MSGLTPDGDRVLADISDGKGCSAKTILDSLPLQERRTLIQQVSAEYAKGANPNALPLSIYADNPFKPDGSGTKDPDKVELGVMRLRANHHNQTILHETIDFNAQITSDNLCTDL